MHVIIYIKQNISIVYNVEDVRGIFSSIIQLCFFHLYIFHFSVIWSQCRRFEKIESRRDLHSQRVKNGYEEKIECHQRVV